METRRRSSKPADLTSLLRRSWYHLRLSVRHPTRVPTWDAIILTAASPDQAQLYHWQLLRAKRLGRIAKSIVTLAVPDPDGARIGSGAATLHALRCLAEHLLDVQVRNSQESNPHSVVREGSNNELTPSSMVNLLEKKHVLLLHAGGDSKRVPWANPMGKVFLPLPYLASDNPDGPVPLLFDHILAISSCARKAFRNEGGIFIMTGDVLPCFDASTIILPDDAACIITVPITLDIASNHGVIITSRKESFDTCSLDMVENLLQKPNLADLMENNAIRHDGRALLDTGIIAVRGGAWVELVKLSSTSDLMISELLETRKEVWLAHQVLEKVVTRYLRRDNLLISSIKRLATLAKVGREAMMNEDIDHLGEIMLEAWRLHQELDPYCSNEFVDKLFAFSDRFCCGYKLVGAGGGGFALLLTKSQDFALDLTRLLKESPEFDVKVFNWNIHLE